MIMIKLIKKIVIGILVVIALAASFYLVIRSESAKITTFEECEKAGWLVRNIKVYDNVGGYGSIEKECTLWSGKSFAKQNVSSAPFFPTQKEPATIYMEALLSDKPEELRLADGCLRVGGYLIIWHYGFSLSTDEYGEFPVIVNGTGQPVARVGDVVIFGGGADETLGGDVAKYYSAQIPNSRCSGPYWILGEIIPPSRGTPERGGCVDSSWDQDIPACIKSLELTGEQKKAAEIAVSFLSYPITILEVKKLECQGCFSVKLQRNDNQNQFTITLEDWKIKN